jgi:hypothetical protein
MKNIQNIFYILFFVIILFIFYLLFSNCLKIKKNESFTSCSKECCQPGWYGNSSSECTPCPFQFSSPFSIPDNNCECKNSTANSCFACTDKCSPFNSVTKTCQPKICPRGKTCNSNTGNCV